MKVKIRKTTPAEIVKEVQAGSENKKDFDLYKFCKLYRHQIADLPWKKMLELFKYIEKKKIKLNIFEFVLPEKEKLKGFAADENKNQLLKNPGLATMVKFLMEDKQISQIEERVLFWINKYSKNNTYREKAREKIINGNKKILFYFLNKLNFKLNHDEGEMLTEGYMELVRMFDKYKPESNYKYLSYAQWSIYQVMKKCICEEQNLIQLPLNVLNQIYKLNAWLNKSSVSDEQESMRQFQQENKITDRNMKLIKKYRKTFGQCSSMDTIVNDSDSKKITIAEVIPEENNKINEKIELDEFKNTLKELLTNDEFEIICYTYGLFGKDKITKKEMVVELPHLNGSKINTIFKEAMVKLSKNKDKLKFLISD